MEAHGIEFEGFEDAPGFRRELIAFIEEFCRDMTLAQARDCFAEDPS